MSTRVAVIGVGHLGHHHARLYAARGDVQLEAVVDSDPGRAAEIAGRHGTRALTDYRDLLGAVDAVSVAVPTVTHHEIALEFLQSGAHVLVEKPITRSLAEADSLIEAAVRAGRRLHVGHTERFNPAVQAVRPLVKRARFIECQRLGAFSPRSLDVDVVLDLMIHDLDVILSLVKAPMTGIDAVGVNALTDRVDIANARLRFDDGAAANVTASRISMARTRKLRIFQPESYLSVDYETRQVQHYFVRKSPGARPEIVGREVEVESGEPLALEIDAFLRAVSGEEDNGVSGADGRRALAAGLQVIEAIERAPEAP